MFDLDTEQEPEKEEIIEPIKDVEPVIEQVVEEVPKKRRGRPKKVVEPDVEEQEEPVDLFDLSEETPEQTDEVVDLFGLADDEEKENIIDEIEYLHEEQPKIKQYNQEEDNDDYLLTQNQGMRQERII